MGNLAKAYNEYLKAYNAYFPTIETISSNTMASVGKENLPQFIFTYRQVNAAGYLTSNELREFSEVGVPLLDLLAKTLNKAQEEIAQRVTDGKISFADVEKALGS